MNKQLEQTLFAKYPIFFGEGGKNLRSPHTIECGDGWYQLVDCFASLCELYSLGYPNRPITAHVVKEKFGELRFQGVSNLPERLEHVMEWIELKSSHICDVCGKDGNIYKSRTGWLLARCDEHACDEHGHWDKFEFESIRDMGMPHPLNVLEEKNDTASTRVPGQETGNNESRNQEEHVGTTSAAHEGT